MKRPPVDLQKLKVHTLAERKSLTRAEDIMVSPFAPLASLSEPGGAAVETCAQARRRGHETRGSC